MGGFPQEDRRSAPPALRAGGTLPAVMNAANEVAVEAFLSGHLAFMGIAQTIEKVMERHLNTAEPSLAEILAADRWARQETEVQIKGDPPG